MPVVLDTAETPLEQVPCFIEETHGIPGVSCVSFIALFGLGLGSFPQEEESAAAKQDRSSHQGNHGEEGVVDVAGRG